MVVIYTTPNGEYMVVKQNDEGWNKVFGNSPTYGICKVSENGELIPVRSPETIDATFSWLRQMRIISLDEMKTQIEYFKRSQ